jgi:ATP-dependent DNA ligase
MQQAAVKATFIESMECLLVTKVTTGADWTHEIKLDGYRLEAVKSLCKVTVYSRRRNILNAKFGHIADTLEELPDETVLDGELVAKRDAQTSISCQVRAAKDSLHSMCSCT